MPEPPPPAPGTLFQRQVLHVAALVERGRWSDFGAVSTVIFGDRLRARAIGAAVRKFGVRPEGSRLLHSDGSVPGNYLREATSEAGDDQRGAPEILQARLEREGIRFTSGRADRAAHVDAAGLRDRMRAHPYPDA